jgi:hypothetical protein
MEKEKDRKIRKLSDRVEELKYLQRGTGPVMKGIIESQIKKFEYKIKKI